MRPVPNQSTFLLLGQSQPASQPPHFDRRPEPTFSLKGKILTVKGVLVGRKGGRQNDYLVTSTNREEDGRVLLLFQRSAVVGLFQKTDKMKLSENNVCEEIQNFHFNITDYGCSGDPPKSRAKHTWFQLKIKLRRNFLMSQLSHNNALSLRTASSLVVQLNCAFYPKCKEFCELWGKQENSLTVWKIDFFFTCV